MSSDIHRSREDFPQAVPSILDNPRQRRLFSILRNRSHPMTNRDLAVQLTAEQGQKSPSAVTGEECQRIRILLHHVDLPKFEAAGLIEREPEGVVATDQNPLDDLEMLFQQAQGVESLPEGTVSALVNRPRRQAVLSILSNQRGLISLDELATELASQEMDTRATDGGMNDTDLRSRLHHVDLPTLDDVGLIEYDSEEKIISVNSVLTE